MNALDQDVRDRIVTLRGTSQSVEAGAGTGKTTLLVDRFLARLEGGTPIARLAVVTFTRKAAAELVGRIRRRLRASKDEGAAWAAAALDDFGRSVVGTTDSFCRAILADFPIEAGISPGFSLADEIAQDALEDEAWRRFLESSVGSDVVKRLREAGVRPTTLRDVARELVSQRDLTVAPIEAPPTVDLIDAFGRRLVPALALRDACRDRTDLLYRHINALEAEWQIAHALGGADGDRALLQRRRRGQRYGSKRGRAAAWGGAPNKARVVDALEALDADVESFLDARGRRLAGEASEWMSGYLRTYAELKRERGLVDFRDLALATRDLLRGNAGVRRRVAERFDEILMDEVQDTDPLQMEIAFLLAAGDPLPEDPFDADLSSGRLFLVGDPKQSIYRFRRADIELYERARARIATAGEAPVIRTNFRSHAAVLRFVNHVFEKWMEPQESTSYQARYVALDAPGKEEAREERVCLLLPDPAVQTQLLRSTRGNALRAPERRELEIDAVARLLRQGLFTPEDRWVVRDPESGESRPARPSDVAVLVRKIDWGDRLLEALRGAGVPAGVAGGKRFYAREEIQTLLALLECVVDPDDRFARFAALRSPALGVPDDDLVLRFLEDPAAPAIEVENRLDELARRAREMALPDFVELLAEELSLLSVFGFRPDGHGRVESLRLLLESIDPLVDAGVDSLPELVRWLRDQMVESRGVEEEDPGDDGGVQILTMHKSKGLEFPIVILADLAGEPRRDQPTAPDRENGRIEFRLSERLRIATPGFDDASEAERLRQQAEDVRLLYVAMTRARDQLVLSWPEGAGGFLVEGELARGVGCEPGEPAPEGSGARTVRAADLPPLVHRPRLLGFDPAAVTPAPPGVQAGRWEETSRAARRGARVHAATSLGRPAPRRKPSGTPGERHRALPPETEAHESANLDTLHEGKDFGRLIHKALELHDPQCPPEETLEKALAIVGRELHALGTMGPVPEGNAVLAYFRRVVSDPAVAAIWRAPRIEKEVPFLLPTGEDFVSGTLDVLVEGGDGTLSIVDYKTDRSVPVRAGGADAARDRYRIQALVYARAAQEITGRVVREVRFLFLSADPVESSSFVVDSDFLAEARSVIGSARMS